MSQSPYRKTLFQVRSTREELLALRGIVQFAALTAKDLGQKQVAQSCDLTDALIEDALENLPES